MVPFNGTKFMVNFVPFNGTDFAILVPFNGTDLFGDWPPCFWDDPAQPTLRTATDR